jgi:hypothetical protein
VTSDDLFSVCLHKARGGLNRIAGKKMSANGSKPLEILMIGLILND